MPEPDTVALRLCEASKSTSPDPLISAVALRAFRLPAWILPEPLIVVLDQTRARRFNGSGANPNAITRFRPWCIILSMIIPIKSPNDFSFAECLNAHGWKSLHPFAWDGATSTLERVEEFEPGNAVLLRIRATESFVEVETDGDVDENEVVRRVLHMLQLDLAIDGFHAYCVESPQLLHIPATRQGRMLRSPTLFEDVLKVICTTNTTWTQTISMVARIVDAYGTPLASDPARKAFPTPLQIVEDSLEEFSGKARLGYRNASAYKIASDVASGTLVLESLRDPDLTSHELYKRLIALPGVGPYAASCLMIYLGRYDRVNVDSWARTLVGKELGRPVSDKEAHAFFEEYGDWKALVYHFYPWREG